MTPLDLATKYMDCVFKSIDFVQLRYILEDDLRFKGPFFEFNSADDYVNSLRVDPPVGFDYQIIRTYADKTSACLVYKFSKPGVTTIMVQIFETENEKIKSILLVFDRAAFRHL